MPATSERRARDARLAIAVRRIARGNVIARRYHGRRNSPRLEMTNSRLCKGFFEVELAGLEPATSWGAIGPGSVWPGSPRLPQVTPVESGSLRAAQFGITIGRRLFASGTTLLGDRFELDTPRFPRAHSTAATSAPYSLANVNSPALTNRPSSVNVTKYPSRRFPQCT